ncbi:MAG: UDP-glucose/GDP-mannose dehydrogenase family protein [Streptosporangiaceae bacterium]|nr:UDP-glucose/GDP-mannose dehydrogenase family protein [Streptosporangiaceae bacterium]MBV9854904.1 UDP-glucose/GDP-mannose dehydrogenase family protein [Streptosporangiaceae bacterium]
MVPRLTVLGTGYLGLVHAACMAEEGFRVLGVDTDPELIGALGRGVLPLHEPGLTAMVRRGLSAGLLSFTTSYRDAAEFGDVHFVCVGTPQRGDGSAGAELSHLEGCLDALAPLLTRPCLVVGKSTVPVGTAARLAARLAERAPARCGAALAWNPEFLREGHAVEDTLCPDRIVAGVSDAAAEAVLRRVYARQLALGVPFVVTDLPTAELVKLAANAFLATKISFINGMAEVCEATGADSAVLADALGYDPRIGGAGMRPGLGFGGGCLPKDIRAFSEQADGIGADAVAGFLRSVDTINSRRRERMTRLAAELAGGSLAGAAVCVLGLAFKPGTDDIRDSPAMDVAAAVHRLGATVTAFDPAAMDRARRACPQLRYAGSAEEAAQGADVILLLTEWPEFAAADPAALAGVVRRRNMADGRHALDPARWRSAGWRYRALGRTHPEPAAPEAAAEAVS